MGQCDDNDMEMETFSDGVASKVSDDSGIEDMNDDGCNFNSTGKNEGQGATPVGCGEGLISTGDGDGSYNDGQDERAEMPCIYPLPLHQMPAAVVHQDVKDENGTPGVCGLQNLGNTCFINAGLQCLMALALPRMTTSASEMKSDASSSDDTIDALINFKNKYQDVCRKMLSGCYSSLCPSDFHCALSSVHCIFGDHKQHDCQEFILFVLNALHEAYDGTMTVQPNQEINSDIPTICHDASVGESQHGEGEDCKRIKIEKAELVEPDAGVECEEGLTESDRSWRAYTKHNSSQIVDTLHGQFKSLVTCGKCGHVSVTHEPFVCASLPIPYAMERQIVVIWLPSLKNFSLGKIRARRFLVTVKEYGVVGDIRSSLVDQLHCHEDSQIARNDIIMAEVKHATIIRTLDDRMQIQYLDTKDTQLYAIETYSVTESCDELRLMDKVEENEGRRELCSSRRACASTSHSVKGETSYVEAEEKQEASAKVSLRGVLSKTRNSLSDDESNSTLGDSSTHTTGESADGHYQVVDNEANHTSTKIASTGWHSCGICLEDTFDSDLTVHANCGGMLCNGCLEATSQYHGSQTFPCPVCRSIISAKDYKSFMQTNGSSKIVRNITVPLLCRHSLCSSQMDGRKKQFTTVGHPTLLVVPSEVQSSLIYEKAVSVLAQFGNSRVFKIVVTDVQGQNCARCDATNRCTGCVLEKDSTIMLRPGDHFTIDVPLFSAEVVSQMSLTADDSSMQKLRETNVVKLDECFDSFCESESLGEENTWYCPRCQVDQIATKVMSISRFPQVAILHLKRFYFEGLQSRKVESPVDFPLENLNLENYSAAENAKDESNYELISCVCHTGDLYTGHYTSYAKHQGSGKWYYYNDEVFTEKIPSSEDFEKAYVLFYQRASTAKEKHDKLQKEGS